MGIGTTGTTLQSPNANDGFLVDAVRDGGSGNLDYRAYANNRRMDPGNVPYYGPGSTAHTDPYYAFLSSHTAPPAQVALSPSTQGGSTPTGIIGFAWHTMTLIEDGTQVNWAIDGHSIATVPNFEFTAGGNQLSLLDIDTGVGGGHLFGIGVFGEVTVGGGTQGGAAPAPGALTLAGMGLATLASYRRFRRQPATV